LLLGIWSSADAAMISDKEDLGIRWDNTLRYNYGVRTRSAEGSLLNNLNSDDGDRNFDRGTVTNRLDVLSEFDMVYKKDYGFRVSAAFWYDQRYRDPMGNDSIATSNHLTNGVQALGLSDQTKRIYRGPDGEVMDAFVFGKVEIAEVPINIKVGRHTVYWGESLLLGGGLCGISYGQMPVDLQKGLANPGVETKEVYRPLGNISMQAQLTDEISLEGQWFFQWEPWKLPEAGSYLGFLDFLQIGGESLLFNNSGALATRIDCPEPDGTKNWGLALHWNPKWLGGTFGFYYRSYADMLPQLGFSVLPESSLPSSYFVSYGDDIDMYGVSASTKIGAVSVGTELSYRKNTPLVSVPYTVIQGLTPFPEKGETFGARGNTWQGLINFMGLLPKTPLFDTAVWITEFTWNHWSHVSSGLDAFNYDGNSIYAGRIDAVTSHSFNGAVNFTPTWFQVFPGMDLSMPMSYSRGLKGNSALNSAIEESAGAWSVGFELDVQQKYKFTLAYAGYFGDVSTDATGGWNVYNGTTALLKDRDTLSFTFKTSF
jgi:hypothetical protein